MTNTLDTLTLAQLDAVPDSQRIIVINPNFDEPYIARQYYTQQNALYIRLVGHKLSVTQAKEQIQAHLDVEANDQTAILILDEFDRVLARAQEPVIQHFLEHTDSLRIVIFSREIPTGILDLPHMNAITTVLPVSADYMLCDYKLNPQAPYLLEVRTLGDNTVIHNGKALDDWTGTLPHMLFLFIIDRGMVTRQEIFNHFWADLNRNEATNVFHVTKRKINAILGQDVILYDGGFYYLKTDVQLVYDVRILTDLLQRSLFEQDMQALAAAEYLYQGVFLPSLSADWISQRRDELQEEYSNALLEAANLASSMEDKRYYLLKARRIAPQQETILEALMHFYRDAGEPNTAIAIYKQHRDALKQEDRSPSAELATLAAEIYQTVEQH